MTRRFNASATPPSVVPLPPLDPAHQRVTFTAAVEIEELGAHFAAGATVTILVALLEDPRLAGKFALVA